MKSISSKMVVYNYNTANKLFEKSNNQLESEPILDLPFQLKKEKMYKPSYTESEGLFKTDFTDTGHRKILTGLQKTKIKNLFVGDMIFRGVKSLLIIYFHNETTMFISKYNEFTKFNKLASKTFAEGQFPELYSKIEGSLL